MIKIVNKFNQAAKYSRNPNSNFNIKSYIYQSISINLYLISDK